MNNILVSLFSAAITLFFCVPVIMTMMWRYYKTLSKLLDYQKKMIETNNLLIQTNDDLFDERCINFELTNRIDRLEQRIRNIK